MGSKESANAGAIDEVVNEEELINRSIEIETNWNQWGNHFREATKHLLHVQTLNDFETHLKHEQTLIEAAGTTMEFKDGVRQLLYKSDVRCLEIIVWKPSIVRRLKIQDFPPFCLGNSSFVWNNQ